MEIRIELPAVKLGVVEGDDIRVRLVDPDLARLMDEVCERKRREFTVESLAEAGAIRQVRSMFREWDIDPVKITAHLRKRCFVASGAQEKGFIGSPILWTLGNLGSIETGWPYGCYDRSRIHSAITLRHGALGESYEGIGKRVWHLEGRPVLADAEGPFGSPISDSTRTMITESAVETLTVIYAPAGTSDEALEAAMGRAFRTHGKICGRANNLCLPSPADKRALSSNVCTFADPRSYPDQAALRVRQCRNFSSFSCFTPISRWATSKMFLNVPTSNPTCRLSRSSRGILRFAWDFTIRDLCLNGSSEHARNYFERLQRDLFESGQVEMVGGGFYEPVLILDSAGGSSRTNRPPFGLHRKTFCEASSRPVAHRTRMGAANPVVARARGSRIHRRR